MQNAYFYTPFKKNLSNLLEILYEKGYISGFSVIRTFLKIFLNKKKRIQKLKLWLFPSRVFSISYRQLLKRNSEMSFFLVLNSQFKITTSNFLLKNKQGGLFLCKLN